MDGHDHFRQSPVSLITRQKWRLIFLSPRFHLLSVLHFTEFTRQSHGALLRRDFSSAALPSLFTSPDICSLRNPNFFLCLLQTNLTCKTLPFLCAGGFCLLTEELPDSEHPAWCCESTAAYQTWKTTRKAKRKHHYCNLNKFLYFQMRFKHIARVFFRVCVFFKVHNSQKKNSNKSCPIRLYLDTDLCSSSLRLFSITPR